jgi:hypothetical protein
MNRLTPDQRSNLSVAGLLLLCFGVALAYFCYRLYGLPVPPIGKGELYMIVTSGLTAVVGIACMIKATDPVR